MLTTSSYQNQFGDLTQNTAPTNTSRGIQLVNQSLRYLTQKYFFNEQQYQILTKAGVQVYQLPFDVKDVINMTVLVGGILWQPLDAPNRQFWDSLNTIPFYSDFPQFSYRFKANQLQLFPIPTSSNDPIQINYKRRIRDLSAADYITGTVTAIQWKSGAIVTSLTTIIAGTTLSYTDVLKIDDVVTFTAEGDLPTPLTTNVPYWIVSIQNVRESTTNPGNTDFDFEISDSQGGSPIEILEQKGVAPMQGGPVISYASGNPDSSPIGEDASIITGSGTSWTQNMVDRWINIPETTSDTTSGDNRWYQIKSIESPTSLTLYNDYQGTPVTGASYAIGEVPLLPEDYQDLALYRALWIYYNSIVPNPNQSKMYLDMYERGKEILDYEFGNKTTSPVLTPPNAPVFNPNLFPRINS